ncbi:hypothetical protein [Tahibacter caeni]|uniref:hypothetical protein n=1 Tax=Tahibacter caeni TaxID=1453545 RepID=UPI0021476AE5|nr:hypothetical protein [Tahibacter caeni]
MLNPWAAIPAAPPFVLPMDSAYIAAANAACEPYAPGWLHTGRMPEPRSGRRDAPVLVLQINPSYDPTTMREALSATAVAEQRAALADEYAPHACLARGDPWWLRAFAQPVAQFGRARVAQAVCSLEYFPYPSRRFSHAHWRLRSQDYQFSLVCDALARGALIVVTRGLSLWLGAVPELAVELGRTVLLSRNPQRVSISPGNLPGGGYERVLAAIESAGTHAS